jgi:hypothetical protein
MVNASVIMFVATVVTFVLLTPGVLVSLPPKGSKLTVAIVHGVLFGILWIFLHKPLIQYTRVFENFTPKDAVNLALNQNQIHTIEEAKTKKYQYTYLTLSKVQIENLYRQIHK